MSSAVIEPPEVQDAPNPHDANHLPIEADDVRFEVMHGELVERNTGMESSWIGGVLFHRLMQVVLPDQLGFVFPSDAGYQCFPDDPKKLRKPDVSFIAQVRMPATGIPQGFLNIAPDLAVEVVSPNDLYSDVMTKVEEYLSVGVKLVWVVLPGLRQIQVFRADSTCTVLHGRDQLSGEQVVPGFSCLVETVFPPPVTPA